ncbi:hypothetical protein [Sphingopyxis sp.]|uniref:hypothetical protein n=1 Tax=Sphingopyxis sp. TaxID=1908224 RepID=UPI003D0D29F7
MRKSIIAVALAATCIAPVQAQMVSAPSPSGAEPTQMGGFVGARVRISLGGSRSEEQKLSAGLTIAPMQYRGGGDLQGFRSRIGEGLEFGFRGKDPAPQLSLAGMRLTGGTSLPGKGRNNLSDVGTVALVVVGVAVVAGIALYAAADEADDV